MADTEGEERLALVTPMIHAACASLVQAMNGMGDEAVHQAFSHMVDDPTEAILWELVDGSRAWDIYESGGPLLAQVSELVFGAGVSPARPELDAWLLDLADAGQTRIQATDDPWRFLMTSAGVPEVTASLLPIRDGAGPEDLAVQVCIGANRLVSAGVMSAGAVRDIWKAATHAGIVNWHRVNSQRALVDHPGFAQVVERPVLGSPGVYLIRVPRLPFSPLMPPYIYRTPVASAVFETAAEFRECEQYYQTPGASVSLTMPLFRNRPPCADRPARLAGGIAEFGHRLVSTPWSDVGAASVVTFPSKLIEAMPPDKRAQLYRGRYAIQLAASVEEAKQAVREAFGTVLDPKTIRVSTSLHPKAAPALVVRSPTMIVVSEANIEQEAHALYLIWQSLHQRPVPQGVPAVLFAGAHADLAEALEPLVTIAIPVAAGDAVAVVCTGLSSEARVIVLDPEALAFASMALPPQVKRGQHGITLVAMVAPGIGEPIIEMARKLDAKVLLLEPSLAPEHSVQDGVAILAGKLKRQGIPCKRIASIPTPPLALTEIAVGLWAGGEALDG